MGFLLSPRHPPTDTTLTVIMMTQHVRDDGQRRAIIEDFVGDLRRRADEWVVTSFNRSRVS